MKNLNRYISLFFILALLFNACETLDKMKEEADKETYKKPRYVISLHRIVKYPRAKNLEKQIQSFSGRKIWVNVNPFLHSRDIKSIKLIKRKDSPKNLRETDDPKQQIGFYDLELSLTHRGAMQWIQLSGFLDEPLAVCLDGMFYREFIPQRMVDEEKEIATLEGPFDEVTARAILKYCKKNHVFFNK